MTSGRPDPRTALIADLGRLSAELAEGAARFVREHADDRLTVTAKSTATDLVTDIDQRTEAWLRDRLRLLRPHDTVLGEEGGVGAAARNDVHVPVPGGDNVHVAGGENVRWVIDPIDGTVNFVLGLPQYAVSIAAELSGQVVAGAVCNPQSGELFHARLGAGAYLGDERLTGPRDVDLARMVVGTGFGYDAARRARQVAVLGHLLPRIADIRRLGAASLDICAVAAGRLDGYFEVGLQRWDYAAGALIAAEAGCAVFGLGHGAPSSALVAVTRRERAQPFGDLLAEAGIASVLD